MLIISTKPEQDRRQKESKPRRPHRKRVEESTSTLDSGSNVGLTGGGGGGQDVMTVTTRPKALSLKASTLDPRVEALCLDLRVEASNSILGSKPQT